MEEVFLRILGGNEAKAAVRNDLLDGTGGHVDLLYSPNWDLHSARSVREEDDHASFATQRGEPPPYHRSAKRAL
jgi:hypothetical protein